MAVSRQNGRRGNTSNRGSNMKNIKQIDAASSRIVKEAAALLDQELAAGILTAKKMQQRFQDERRIDPADFKGALARFQNDGHEVVNLLNNRLAELRSKESADLVTHLVSNTHDLLDLMVGLVNMGSEIANQLAQANLPKRNENKARR